MILIKLKVYNDTLLNGWRVCGMFLTLNVSLCVALSLSNFVAYRLTLLFATKLYITILTSQWKIILNYLRVIGHNFKIFIPVYFSNVRRHYFASRVVPIWNSLSFEIVNLSNVVGFKKRLKFIFP